MKASDSAKAGVPFWFSLDQAECSRCGSKEREQAQEVLWCLDHLPEVCSIPD